jgi:hypothetical protein
MRNLPIDFPSFPQVRNPHGLCTGQSGTHSHEARGLDSYATPRIATEKLLAADPDVINSSARIWEPMAGHGAIVYPLRDAGIPVIASDITQYAGCPLHFIGDFLAQEKAPAGCGVVVTNPAFAIAAEVARHALTLVPDVYLLLRLAFLESASRADLLEHSGLRKVFVFRNLLPRMHREGWTRKKSSSSVCFAWFAWRRHYNGLSTLHRI